MRKKIACSIAIVLIHLWATPGLTAPPKVVKAVPDNGDIDVDPNLKEIRITFDQPMGKGMSPVAGGDTDPQSGATPRWITSRTIVIPVKLQPNHDYWLSERNAN